MLGWLVELKREQISVDQPNLATVCRTRRTFNNELCQRLLTSSCINSSLNREHWFALLHDKAVDLAATIKPLNKIDRFNSSLQSPLQRKR